MSFCSNQQCQAMEDKHQQNINLRTWRLMFCCYVPCSWRKGWAVLEKEKPNNFGGWSSPDVIWVRPGPRLLNCGFLLGGMSRGLSAVPPLLLRSCRNARRPDANTTARLKDGQFVIPLIPGVERRGTSARRERAIEGRYAMSAVVYCPRDANNNNNRIFIAPYDRNFRGAANE